MQKSEVAIWMPLGPELFWEGEGIAGTIDNIVMHLPSDTICHVVVSKHHYEFVSKRFEGKPNVKVVAIGLSSWRKNKRSDRVKKYTSTTALLSQIAYKMRLTFIKKLMLALKYRCQLYAYGLLQKKNLFLPNCSVFWFPVFWIPCLNLLKGEKIFSFWDPFIFEYREFSQVSHALFARQFSLYRDASTIITQSETNKHFLTHVLQVNAERITVIPSGSPDYSVFYDELLTIGKRNKEGLLEHWLSDGTVTVADQINKSILWRLLGKLNTSEDKVLMVSTQVRPYKGFQVLFELLNKLVCHEESLHYHFIFTAELPSELKNNYPLLFERIHEITRVSRKQHALLYYISDLALHPSFVEGGAGTYPQFEAASVGVPCLVNMGRHVVEQSPDEAIRLRYATDFTEIETAIERINQLICYDGERLENIKTIQKLSVLWDNAAKKYDEVFQRAVYVE